MYVCDLVWNIFLYADDAKLFRHIRSVVDNMDLQNVVEHARKVLPDMGVMKTNTHAAEYVQIVFCHDAREITSGTKMNSRQERFLRLPTA